MSGAKSGDPDAQKEPRFDKLSANAGGGVACFPRPGFGNRIFSPTPLGLSLSKACPSPFLKAPSISSVHPENWEAKKGQPFDRLRANGA
jgi:hypothetical protein